MVSVLEAVPNFSEGRDLDLVRELVSRIARPGVEVVDWSADPDHHRSVITFLGDPPAVEEAAVDAARLAVERIDLRRHRGVHPRVGALDVLPFVPLGGLDMEEAVAAARRVGARIAELGVPVYWYGRGTPGSRTLAEIRRGGFEALSGGIPAGRGPDLPAGRSGAVHPTAGATCVGARPLLLAWNVYVEGVDTAVLRSLAAEIRESPPGGRSAGGATEGRSEGTPAQRFRGLRALALELPRAGKRQISMNIEDLQATSPFDVFSAIERRVESAGGRVSGTEVIGMIPDGLVLPAATDRLGLLESHPSRLLSTRLAEHVSVRAARAFKELRDAVDEAGDAGPPELRSAMERFMEATRFTRTPGDNP